MTQLTVSVTQDGVLKTVPLPECRCQGVHRPAVLEPQQHHLWPVYLHGPQHPGTLLGLCPTTHANVHRVLRAMVKAGRIMSRQELREPGRPNVPLYAWWTACSGFNAWDAAGRP